jgi:hypothetical protein
MDEGESPVGLAHFLARCTKGNSKKLVSARQSHFDGLGFFGLGFRRRGVLWGFDAVGFAKTAKGSAGAVLLNNLLNLIGTLLYFFFRGLGDA